MLLLAACGGGSGDDRYALPADGNGFDISGYAARDTYQTNHYATLSAYADITYADLPSGSVTYTGQTEMRVRDSGGVQFEKLYADTALTFDFDTHEVEGAMTRFVGDDGSRSGFVEVTGGRRSTVEDTDEARYQIDMAGKIESGGELRNFNGLLVGSIAGPNAEAAQFVIAAAASEMTSSNGSYYGTVNGSVYLGQ